MQFAHENRKSRIIYVQNAHLAHPFSYFIIVIIRVIIENRTYVLLKVISGENLGNAVLSQNQFFFFFKSFIYPE